MDKYHEGIGISAGAMMLKWDEMNNQKPASISSITKDFDCLKRIDSA